MNKIAITVVFILFFSLPAFADIFRYVDENGVVCYTDSPTGKKMVRVHKDRAAETAMDGNENKPAVKNRPSVVPSISSGNDVFAGYVNRAATKYEIDPELIQAVIKTESNGNHRAVSRKGAKGLMQLMPSTAYDMQVSNPFNPEENIEGGTRYLRYLIEKFNGDLTLALAAYNAGPKTVEKYGNVPPITETRQYVNKVYSLYKGKKSYDTAGGNVQQPEIPKPTPIYKVVLDDGTVLFTNSSLQKSGKIRF